MKALLPGSLILLIVIQTQAAAPTTDPTVDWLLGQATTAPATQPTLAAPATQPIFTKNPDDAARPGTLTLSDGTTLTGPIATTPGKPIRIWQEDQKQYQDFPLSMVKSIEAEVVWERDEQEWRFAASGSDIKTFTGRTYPARLTNYKITLTNGQTFDGAIVAPLIITVNGKPKTYVLHKRDKGDVGQTLAQLLYVKRVTFP